MGELQEFIRGDRESITVRIERELLGIVVIAVGLLILYGWVS